MTCPYIPNAFAGGYFDESVSSMICTWYNHRLLPPIHIEISVAAGKLRHSYTSHMVIQETPTSMATGDNEEVKQRREILANADIVIIGYTASSSDPDRTWQSWNEIENYYLPEVTHSCLS